MTILLIHTLELKRWTYVNLKITIRYPSFYYAYLVYQYEQF